MNPRAAIFDLGMVLSTPTGLYEGLARLLDTTPEAVEKGFWGAHRHAYDEGIPDRAYWESALSLIEGHRVDDLDALLPELVTTDTGGWREIRDEARAILTDLGERGTRVFVLSNAPRSFAETAPGFSWSSLVERFFFSGLLGVAKPSPEIYARVESELGLPGESMWFVDDKPENVATASDRGWHAHLWVDDADTRAWLTEEGFLS
ncbi:MAG TPA: HAD-IA family hydrolase [Propionibacteriaceae bacterium]|nr:HAD-IA family hydrolase [Propionibacteriaceae bacterium]